MPHASRSKPKLDLLTRHEEWLMQTHMRWPEVAQVVAFLVGGVIAAMLMSRMGLGIHRQLGAFMETLQLLVSSS